MGRGPSPAIAQGPRGLLVPALGLALALAVLLPIHPVSGDGNVGCLFSSSLCADQAEWCYNDHAFGKCLKTSGDVKEEDLLRHELNSEELRAFERELQRLLLLGYRWSHFYTQCVLQAMLHAIKTKLQYQPAVCDNLSDQDLTAALGALETGSEQVNPDEVAFVRFTPNADPVAPDADIGVDTGADLDSSDFADEVYFPPADEYIRNFPTLPEPHMAIHEQETPSEYEPWQETLKRSYRRKHKRSKEHLFTRVYNTPGNFRQGHETRDLSVNDLDKLFNNEYLYIPNENADTDAGPRGDYGSNRFLTSQDILHLLRPENEEELKGFLSQLDSYQQEGDDSNFHLSEKDPINRWLEKQDLEQLRSTLAELRDPYSRNMDPYYLSTSEFLTKNRIHSDRFNQQYNTPDSFRQGFETKDIVLDEKQGPEEEEMVEPRIYVDEDDVEHLREDSGSGEHDGHADRLRELEYLTNNQIMSSKEYPPAYDGSYGGPKPSDSALLTRLLNIWRTPDMSPLSGAAPAAPVYTEGGMVYLPTPTETEDSESTENSQLLDRSLGALLADYEWGFRRKERLDVKKPGPPFDTHNVHFKQESQLDANSSSEKSPPMVKKGEESSEIGEEKEDTTQEINKSHDIYDVDSSYAYVGLKDSIRTWKEGARIVQTIGELLHLEPSAFSYPRVDRNEVTFRVEDNSKSWNASEVAARIDDIKDELKKELGVEITSAGVGDKTKYPAVLRMEAERDEWMDWDNWSDTGTMWAALIAGTLAAAVAATALFLLARHHQRRRDKVRDITGDGGEASKDYQDLCRARMAGKWPAGSGGIGGSGGEKESQRIASLSKDSDGNSPSTRSSTSSWSEEPALTNMDISTGHMVLTYMEDHLKNKDRLEQEWRALCAYEAEPCSTKASEAPENVSKNRSPGVLPYDHSRIVLNDMTNIYNSDYINASTITDHDPRNPAYIAAQGPLAETTADWWQMVWEQGSVVLVMLTRLSEGSVLCHRYWPEEGSQLYHIYEVHLVSEHIWCDDYLVRSFYLKNLKTGETRTVTQFHFLSWSDRGVPSSTKALLEFRRKVNKSYRGRSCPIAVHCSDGAGRTGTYCLIDMVLNRMAKGAKEIDIAATLEHIRDQRPHMVTTKQQFEFVLMAVAEEVHAILKALPAQLQQQHEKREKELAAEKEKQDKEKEN